MIFRKRPTATLRLLFLYCAYIIRGVDLVSWSKYEYEWPFLYNLLFIGCTCGGCDKQDWSKHFFSRKKRPILPISISRYCILLATLPRNKPNSAAQTVNKSSSSTRSHSPPTSSAALHPAPTIPAGFWLVSYYKGSWGGGGYLGANERINFAD